MLQKSCTQHPARTGSRDLGEVEMGPNAGVLSSSQGTRWTKPKPGGHAVESISGKRWRRHRFGEHLGKPWSIWMYLRHDNLTGVGIESTHHSHWSVYFLRAVDWCLQSLCLHCVGDRFVSLVFVKSHEHSLTRCFIGVYGSHFDFSFEPTKKFKCSYRKYRENMIKSFVRFRRWSHCRWAALSLVL